VSGASESAWSTSTRRSQAALRSPEVGWASPSAAIAAPASGLVTDCHVEIGSGPTEAPARDQVAFQTRMYLN